MLLLVVDGIDGILKSFILSPKSLYYNSNISIEKYG